MKITILGSGVIGVTSAYMLAARGHEVTVIDRNPESASETSFANGGQLSFSHAEPWANDTVLPKVLKWMFREDAPLIFRLRADPQMIGWGLRFLRNCTREHTATNSVNILRLGIYSKKVTEQIRTVTGINFDNVREGILHVFSQQAEFDHALEQARFQEKFGCSETVLDKEGCINMEPSLQHSAKNIVGGLHAPLDESGDALTFTRELAKICAKELNVQFQYSTAIEQLETSGNKITGVKTSRGEEKADAYIMSLGSYSPLYLKPLGIKVPIYPMKGYSITFPANIATPKMSITDTEVKLVYSRLGNRIRVAGTAEFAGYDTSINERRITPIVNAVKQLFPQAELDGDLHRWACLRPSTPDGPPLIGKCRYDNLYLNTGHGTLGWTQAAGSARLIADIIEDRPTDISLTGLAANRYL